MENINKWKEIIQDMNLWEKLTALQNELNVPKGRRNAFGKYDYRSAEDILKAVKPLLLKHRLSQIILDEIVCIEERHYLKATVVVTDIDNPIDKEISTGLAREELDKKGMDSAQITGSTSSYARKYALNGMYSIDETESDPDSMNNGEEQGDKLTEKIQGNIISATELEALYSLASDRGFDRAKAEANCKAKFRVPLASIDKSQYKIMFDGYTKLKSIYADTPFAD